MVDRVDGCDGRIGDGDIGGFARLGVGSVDRSIQQQLARVSLQSDPRFLQRFSHRDHPVQRRHDHPGLETIHA